MTRKRIGYLIVALLLVALFVWAFRPAPVEVDLATVERGPLTVTIDEEGETRVRHRYVISAPVPGSMQRINLEPGDRVEANRTVLAVFAPSRAQLLDARTRAELEARVRAAQAAVGRARAERDRLRNDLRFARTNLKRQQNLFESGAVSREQLEDVEQQTESLEHALESAEFALRTAGHELEVAQASLTQPGESRAAPIELRSPVDGVVLQRLQQSETVVPAGTPLLEVGRLDRLEIVADLLSAAAVRVEPGLPVLVEQWGGETALKARVRRVEPSGFTKISALGVEEQRVNVVMDFEDAGRVPLGDGYRVEVRIIVWSRDDVLKVPMSALFRHESEWAAFRVEEGRAVRRPVEIGQRNGLEAEVLSGLDAGDRTIVFPSDAVSDGVAVAERTAR